MHDIQIEKNSKIVVNVDESLPDILVVSYEYGSKLFQGVLLDSTKRNLPYGVTNLHPAYANDKNDIGEDRLFSANQRFTYQEGVSAVAKEFTQKRSVRLPARYKNSKMTVRLRPRQVLCSKCRGICNENSENVDATRKRKANEEESSRQQQKRVNAPNTRASRPLSSDSQSNEQQRTCLRLAPGAEAKTTDLSTASAENLSVPLTVNSTAADCNERLATTITANPQEFKDFKEPSPRKEGRGKRMVLRKKKSVGSMEDLWDESVFEESGGAAGGPGADLAHSTRTIKISFGREGEGTVLKIPAKIEDLDTTVSKDIVVEKVRSKDASAKAARRALKKAKKEARRKILLGSGGSPCYALGSGSPRYTLAGNGSPRYTFSASASPRHGLGGTSPRYAVTASTPSYENLVPRRHKHKMKHKKKHREDRRAQRDNTTENTSSEPAVPEESYTEMKEQCLKQKLSINLKRLNASAYTRCDESTSSSSLSTATTTPATTVEDHKSGAEENSECSDEQIEQHAPDFPPPSPPVMMRITAQAVTSGLSADGRRLGVGDVVWGKIHGFPWWPGKVLSITDTDTTGPQAHVAWYGSSTSSLMPCDQLSPFLENFKIRYNKKKRGPYKEAIKQATCEARIETPPAPLEVVPSLVQPALASPREIDVVS
ncbi:six-banded [Carabus blaptoides fortunei]